MIIGIPRESLPGETRVAATPQTVGQLIKLGYQVVVESGAGAASSFADDAYAEAGATVGAAAGVRTVAFPAISTGVFGYPRDEAAHIAVTSVRSAVLATPDAFDEVLFVCFSDEMMQTFLTLFPDLAA